MPTENVIITNKEKFETVKARIAADGPGKLHVVSDFDKTITSCFVDGKKIVSLISILRDEHYLTPDYSEKAQTLYDKYHPIEIDPAIPLDVKKAKMYEWWSTHYELLIQSGLRKDDLKKVADSKKISLRPGALDFFDFLKAKNIPLVILSSGGLGTETIEMYLGRFGKLYENVQIVSNTIIWDEFGKAVDIRQPIIHSFNKDYTAVKAYPIFDEIKKRKNVILLGDSVGDVDMLNGFDCDNVIKIGFLNENSKGELADFRANYDIIILNDGSMDYVLESFKQAFDVVILNDGPMDYVNILLRDLVK